MIDRCKACRGTGHNILDGSRCEACNGTGEVGTQLDATPPRLNMNVNHI